MPQWSRGREGTDRSHDGPRNLAFNNKLSYFPRQGTAIMPSHLSRITTNPEICGGRPCIANTRMRVSDVLDLLAAGETRMAILEDYSYLADEDIKAALEYAPLGLLERADPLASKN
jgi:uncharacterized protein (DUF433 family)